MNILKQAPTMSNIIKTILEEDKAHLKDYTEFSGLETAWKSSSGAESISS